MSVRLLLLVLLLSSCSDPSFKPEATAELEHLRPDEISQSEWDSILHQHFSAVRDNANFSFYGKIVDDLSRPIEGAIVCAEVSSNNDDLEASLRTKTFRAPKRNLTVTSSTDGSFEIAEQRGFTLTLLSITKEGFALQDRQWFSYSVTSDGEPSDALGEQSDPIIFRMTALPE